MASAGATQPFDGASAEQSATATGPSSKKISSALGAIPGAYFREAAAVGRAAVASSRSSERCYRFGGLVCLIRYANEVVEAGVHRALQHLELPAGAAADLTVGVWDQARCEHVLPDAHPLMEQYYDYESHCQTLCSNSRYLALDERWLGVRSYVDRYTGEAWYCIGDIDALPYYERAAPMRPLLTALLVSRNRHLVHGSALGTTEAGVLMPGPAGAGKSSTALSCLRGRLRHVADDWCGVWVDDVSRVFSVYNTAKLRLDSLDRFPEMRAKIHGYDRLDDEKATLFLAEHWREALLESCPVKAILLPEVAHQTHTTIEPARRKVAWHAVLSWSLSQLPGCRPQSATLLTRLCSRLPAYHLRLGSDPREVCETVENFIDGL